MSRIQEHIDVNAPAQTVWDQLHRVKEYPSFMNGVQHAHTHDAGHVHLDVQTGGGEQAFEAVLSDRSDDQIMAWQTQGVPEMQGSLSVSSLDKDHSQVQVRMEYDPESICGAFGGPKGMAQVHAVEQTIRGDLKQFKKLVEGAK